jgi:hypothetical protein
MLLDESHVLIARDCSPGWLKQRDAKAKLTHADVIRRQQSHFQLNWEVSGL